MKCKRAVSCCGIVCGLAVLLIQAPVMADSPASKKFGRLSDGTAYRIDSHGYQIKDYLAELEVTVDALKRQVRALETEVNEKRTQIAELKDGSHNDSVIEEKLIAGSSNARRSELDTNKLPSSPESCAGFTAPILEKVSRLEQKLSNAELALGRKEGAEVGEQENQELETAYNGLRRLAEIQEAELQQKRAAFERLQEENVALRDRLAGASEKLANASAVSGYKDRLEREHQQLREAERALESMRQDFAKLSQEAKDLRVEREALRSALANAEQLASAKVGGQERLALQAEKLKEERAELAKQLSKREVLISTLRDELSTAKDLEQRLTTENKRLLAAHNEPRVGQRARVSYPSSVAKVSRAKSESSVSPAVIKELENSVSRIRSLVLARKRLMKVLQSSGNGVSVQLKPVVSRKGEELSDMRDRVKQIGSPAEVAQLREDLRYLARIVEDDIKLLQRLNRM